MTVLLTKLQKRQLFTMTKYIINFYKNYNYGNRVC